LNKGRTLESWVGEERAREIKAKMSLNSLKKAPHLNRLNRDPEVLKRRKASRKYHDEVVCWLAQVLRRDGCRVFVLSEYIKEKRTPDAIVFNGKELIALEVETEKKWKPSHASIIERLNRANSYSRFFDRTEVVFAQVGTLVDQVGPLYLAQILP
jgi:hypothetical protein